jgi:hypothetical protein
MKIKKKEKRERRHHRQSDIDSIVLSRCALVSIFRFDGFGGSGGGARVLLLLVKEEEEKKTRQRAYRSQNGQRTTVDPSLKK